jgi:hypothetical protein
VVLFQISSSILFEDRSTSEAMNTVEQIDDAVIRDDLLQLELQIARRADRLAQSRGNRCSEEDDLICWQEAEREVLSRVTSLALVAT